MSDASSRATEEDLFPKPNPDLPVAAAFRQENYLTRSRPDGLRVGNDVIELSDEKEPSDGGATNSQKGSDEQEYKDGSEGASGCCRLNLQYMTHLIKLTRNSQKRNLSESTRIG